MAASKYPDEIRRRAVRMVFEVCKQTGYTRGVIARVARQLGVGAETLRLWVCKAEVDEGLRPGLATAEAQRVAALERENRELRRADEILKARPRLSSRASSILSAQVTASSINIVMRSGSSRSAPRWCSPRQRITPSPPASHRWGRCAMRRWRARSGGSGKTTTGCMAPARSGGSWADRTSPRPGARWNG